MTTTTDWLAEESQLFIKQKHEWTEILTGWETRNRYDVRNTQGQSLLMAGETKGNILWVLVRQQLAGFRPFTIELRDCEGKLWLAVRRPWRWILDRAEILDGDGRHVGSIQQRFAVIKRIFTMLDAAGQPVAEIVGPFWRPWTFEITVNGRPAGAIRKKWSGLGKEMFTDADTFGVEFGPEMPPAVRALCLGATFLIDFAYFERSR